MLAVVMVLVVVVLMEVRVVIMTMMMPRWRSAMYRKKQFLALSKRQITLFSHL